MVSGWQRPPTGMGLQILQERLARTRNPSQQMPSLSQLSEEDFVALMKEQGASDHMIEQELPAFRQLKEVQDAQQQRRQDAKEERQAREVTEESLQPYVLAGKRRRTRVAAQEKESDEDKTTPR